MKIDIKIILLVAVYFVFIFWGMKLFSYRDSLSTSPFMIDLSNLSFVIFNNVCRDVTHTPILAVMLVTSRARNARRRTTIREAYPTSELATLGIRRVFLLASLVNNTKPGRRFKVISQDALIEENRLHEDILQINFTEAYTNLPYKNLMGLKYASTYCNSSQFVIKVDDDSIYDVYQLAEVLKSVKEDDKDNLFGDIYPKGEVIRRSNSSLYVPQTQYPYYYYPAYLSGANPYFTSIKTAAVLLETSKLVPFISVEDALITGILAERAGIQRHQMDRLTQAETLHCCRDVANNIMYRCDYVASLQWVYRKEKLLKISRHAAYCYYNKNCTQRSDSQLYPSNITCF